jgi:hypothetical protein
MAYVVNEDANQRIMTKRGHDGGKVIAMPRASRLHEGGFRFAVGRAGILTTDGRIPFGSTFFQGIYLLEESTKSDFEISFHGADPTLLNAWSTAVKYEYLYHEVLGESS